MSKPADIHLTVDQINSKHQELVEISSYIGMSIGEYNAKKTDNFATIIRYTLEYCKLVKELYACGNISQKTRDEYYTNIGRLWSFVNY
jgi:hypothetical protein